MGKNILAIGVVSVIPKGDLALYRASVDQLKDFGTIKLCYPSVGPWDFTSRFFKDINQLPHPSELTIPKILYRRLIRNRSQLKQTSISKSDQTKLKTALSRGFNRSFTLSQLATTKICLSFFNNIHPNEVDIAVVLGHTLEKSILGLCMISYFFPKLVLKKPTIIFPFSLSQIGLKECSRREVFLIKMAMRLVDVIFLRERKSYEYLIRLMGTRKSVFQAGDTAFLLSEAPLSDVISKLDKLGIELQRPAVGVALNSDYFRAYRKHYNQAKYYAFIIKIARLLDRIIRKSGASIYFIPMTVKPHSHTFDDMCFTKECVRHMQHHEKVQIVNTLLMNPYEMKTLLGTMDFLITMRLHAGILAMGKYVPTVMIIPAKDTKAIALAERLGIKDYFIDLDYAIEAEFNQLYQIVSKAIKNRDTIREMLKITIPNEQKLAAIPLKIIKNIL